MSSPRRFPASPALGSSDSAEARAPLFAGLTATMAESDCFTAYISGVRLLPSRCGPPDRNCHGGTVEPSQVPVLDIHTCLSS